MSFSSTWHKLSLRSVSNSPHANLMPNCSQKMTLQKRGKASFLASFTFWATESECSRQPLADRLLSLAQSKNSSLKCPQTWEKALSEMLGLPTNINEAVWKVLIENTAPFNCAHRLSATRKNNGSYQDLRQRDTVCH